MLAIHKKELEEKLFIILGFILGALVQGIFNTKFYILPYFFILSQVISLIMVYYMRTPALLGLCCALLVTNSPIMGWGLSIAHMLVHGLATLGLLYFMVPLLDTSRFFLQRERVLNQPQSTLNLNLLKRAYHALELHAPPQLEDEVSSHYYGANKDAAYHVKDFVAPDLCHLIYAYFSAKPETTWYRDGQDQQVPGSLNVYGDKMIEALSLYLLPKIEAIIGEPLYPTYTWTRMYHTHNRLPKHRDRHSCEITATICLGVKPENQAPWPLQIETQAGEHFTIAGQVGDLILYRGIEQYHWREPYAGDKILQVFLHYVRKRGPYRHYRYDLRKNMGEKEIASGLYWIKALIKKCQSVIIKSFD